MRLAKGSTIAESSLVCCKSFCAIRLHYYTFLQLSRHALCKSFSYNIDQVWVTCQGGSDTELHGRAYDTVRLLQRIGRKKVAF
jgi:hypothetical protein